MHADNAGIKVGDNITVGGQSFKVVGLIAYVNYSTLHEKNTDLIFDALKFDVAMVTESGFDRLDQVIHYTYAWKYEKEPEDEKEEKNYSDDFLKVLLTQTVAGENEIEDYIPRYANSAINFATDDMGSDEAMGGVLLDILIVIIAFIFAVTISNTITKESQTIGTLRASGYSKGELILHYLSMPVIVTLIAACVGNLFGYSVFKNVVVSMYYNSYSLPAYETIWNPDAFFKTTLISVMLAMAVGMPDTLEFYKENAEDMMFARYQYVLKSYKDEEGNKLASKNHDAEKFIMKSLQKKSDVLDEEISVYGISDDSRYVRIVDLKLLKEGNTKLPCNI